MSTPFRFSIELMAIYLLVNIVSAQIDPSCKRCGVMGPRPSSIPLASPLIINGAAMTPVAKYPWIVSLSVVHSKKLYCGGAIISATFVLTAAHCLLSKPAMDDFGCSEVNSEPLPHKCFMRPSQLSVGFLGTEHLVPRKKITAARLFIGPGYDGVLNDIALIELRERITCDRFSSPICLPIWDLSSFKNNLIIAGWGFSKKSEIGAVNQPMLLKEGRVSQVKSDVCKHRMKNEDPRTVFCTVANEYKQGSCMGDSGSSVFQRFGGYYYALGVTSTHMSPTCRVDYPVRFIKVYAYMHWITQVVRDLPTPQGGAKNHLFEKDCDKGVKG